MITALPIQFLPPAIRTSRAFQEQFGLGDPKFRPLSDVKTVLRDLGEFEIDEQHIHELVESRFLVGFDISLEGGRTARCLRVLTKSVKFFRANIGKKYHELEWPQIFRLVVPHQKPVVTGLEVRRSLLCVVGHVENLINAGHLVALQKARPGPGGSPTICRTSFENFLQRRLL